MPDTVVPKTQTTSPTTPHFQRFSPKWSAFWAPHHPKLPPHRLKTGGMTPSKPPTRRRHAVRGLRMAQNPPLPPTKQPHEGPQGEAAVPVGGGGTWPGFETTHRTRQQRPSPTGVEGAGGTGGHGRASRRGAERSEALASRAAGPSGARNTRGATSSNTRRDGSRAGRRPPAHTAARPSKQPSLTKHTRRPEHPWGRKQQPGKTKTADPERICGFIVREGGVEPPLHHWNTDLNRARLPIPPLARTQKE